MASIYDSNPATWEIAQRLSQLRATLRRYDLNPPDCEELLQYAFERLMSEQPHICVRAIERSARKMACDVHIDFSRRKTWKNPPSVVAKQEPDRAGDSTSEESIDVGSDVEDELSLLCAILSALPSERREVFRLYRVELLRDKQIVERTGLCLSTVRRHIKRSMGLYTRVEELLKSRKRAVETGA